MERILARRFFPLVVVVVAALATTQTQAQQDLPCITELAACSQYYNNTALTPSADCCGPLANALKKEVPCICAVFSNPSVQKQLGINLETGFGLFARCNITGASPNICTSAAPASPPKLSPGKSPTGAASRAEWIGFSAFFSLLLVVVA